MFLKKKSTKIKVFHKKYLIIKKIALYFAIIVLFLIILLILYKKLNELRLKNQYKIFNSDPDIDLFLNNKAEYYKKFNNKTPIINNLIISLASFPARIDIVHLTIESLLRQTMQPNKIILWLAESDFPSKEKSLPLNLLELCKKGLTIDYYNQNIKSYLKLIPTLKKYPNKIIITTDDDNMYHKDMVEKLYKSFLKHPKDIHAHRITKITYESGEFKVIPEGIYYYKNSSFLNKLTGVGGVLYPPRCFYKDIYNEKLFMKLAPTSDDLWFWIQGILNNIRVRVVEKPNIYLNLIENSQKIGLYLENDGGPNLFWKHFNNLISYYPKLKNILIEEFFSHNKLSNI